MAGLDLWDTLSVDYDRFVNWEERLAREMPFLERQLSEHRARRVLDVACGTGCHALALAQRGYEVVGTDISAGMVERARQNAEAAATAVSFVQAGFGELREVVGAPFDALLCLGNSLPSVPDNEALGRALEDMAQVLTPGGLLFIQNLNYDRLWPKRQRLLPLETRREDDKEWVFLRFMDFHEQSLTFNMVVLHKQNGSWNYWAESAELRPIFAEELENGLRGAGFAAAKYYGDYTANPYEQNTSGDLIVVAQRQVAQQPT
jgi:ubiquinone/menaquinone biosynthesis C-methylase UbiE